MTPADEVLNLLRERGKSMTSQEVCAALQHRPWVTLVRIRGLLSLLKRKGLVDQMGSNPGRYDWGIDYSRFPSASATTESAAAIDASCSPGIKCP